MDTITVEIAGAQFEVSPDTAALFEGIAEDEGRYAVKDCKTGDWIY